MFFATVKNIYCIVRRRTTGSICRAWRIFRRCASSCNICFPLTSGPTIWPRARLRRARAGKRCRPGSCGASRAGRASSRRLRARASTAGIPASGSAAAAAHGWEKARSSGRWSARRAATRSIRRSARRSSSRCMTASACFSRATRTGPSSIMPLLRASMRSANPSRRRYTAKCSRRQACA